jgi:hypothetical protein
MFTRWPDPAFSVGLESRNREKGEACMNYERVLSTIASSLVKSKAIIGGSDDLVKGFTVLLTS